MMPTVILQKPTAEMVSNNIQTGYNIIDHFKQYILIATLRVSGFDVLLNNSQYKFVRDTGIYLPPLNTYIHGKSNYRSKFKNGQESVVSALKNMDPSTSVVNIEGAYFEGGNVFCSATQSVLLHGLNPYGHYKETMNSPFAVDPSRTNELISASFPGIEVIGVSLSDKVDIMSRMEKYYHLDCFMQLLPNDTLVILNKEMISSASLLLLQQKFEIIDLAYPDYIHESCMLNFITIESEDSKKLISGDLPESVVQSLTELGYQVYMPRTLHQHQSNAPLLQPR